MTTAAKPSTEAGASFAEPTRCRSLASLEPGAAGWLCDHPDAAPLPSRLLDLGFVPGTRLEVVREAPLGDPVELELRGYRICLRRADLSPICLRPDPASR